MTCTAFPRRLIYLLSVVGLAAAPTRAFAEWAPVEHSGRNWGFSLFRSLPPSTVPTPTAASPYNPGANFPPTVLMGLTPAQACRLAIAAAERAYTIPPHLLAAIARVESGRPDGEGGISPWPWSINVEGVDHIYDTKAAVIAAVQSFQAQGIRSIDTGCLQVNLMYHPDAFASLAAAFDPVANANYAAKFLVELFAKTGSWEAATAAYHSADPAVGGPYQRKVAAVQPEEERRADPPGASPLPPHPTAFAAAGGGAAPAMAGGNIAGVNPGGRMGPMILGMRTPAPRGLPMQGGTGRSLASYRQAPVPFASLMFSHRPGNPG